jgi:hypothetical protein
MSDDRRRRGPACGVGARMRASFDLWLSMVIGTRARMPDGGSRMARRRPRPGRVPSDLCHLPSALLTS